MISSFDLERIAQNAGTEISGIVSYPARAGKFSRIAANLHSNFESCLSITTGMNPIVIFGKAGLPKNIRKKLSI